MEFWSRLMPEDEEIRGVFYLAKVSSVRTKGELEELVRELCKELGITGDSPREGTLEEPVYKEALTCAWQRFGYPKALAEGRTRILCSEEEGEMEYLAEEIRSFWSTRNGRERYTSFWEISGRNRGVPGKLSKIISWHWIMRCIPI